MVASSGEPNPKPSKPRGIRIAVLAVIIVVVFVAGVGVGVLVEQTSLPTIHVTPSVAIIGLESRNVSSSSSCDGGSQTSFNGYFVCTVTLACVESGPGNFEVQNASAPAATNLAVTPTLPQLLFCNSPGDYRIAGQLGYTGSVTIYLAVN
jgi:hypothetical protein